MPHVDDADDHTVERSAGSPLVEGTRRFGLSRRRFIGGAGVGVVAIGVGACSSEDTPAEPPSTAGEPPLTDGPDSTTSSTTTTTSSTTTTTTTVPEPPPALPPGLASQAENWQQPDVFRADSGEVLSLTVQESDAANSGKLLFSFNGKTPGPTIRAGGDATVRVQLVNGLGLDAGRTPIGPNPAGVNGGLFLPGPEGTATQAVYTALAAVRAPLAIYDGSLDQNVRNRIPTTPREDWCLGEHVNGVHTLHVTNLHTHGLHVRPGRNPNGTHSDNIYLRVLSEADWQRVQQNPECVEQYDLALERKDGDILGAVADYEFDLGRTDATPLHPPGTHWYHPHSHGATHNQVASGMAGFLIVEGDVDAVLNEQLADDPDADPDVATGPWDYRERTVFIQNVFVNQPNDTDRLNLFPPRRVKRSPMTNGSIDPSVMVMRPGAVERWRVLNGSVDGAGYIRFMVLKGRFEVDQGALVLVDDETGDVEVVTEDEFGGTLTIGTTVVPIKEKKAHLWQLSWDGVTLVDSTGDAPTYTLKDLREVNGGSEPEFENEGKAYQDEHLKLVYNRPDELAFAPANRADVLFEAPPLDDDASAHIFTLLAMPTAIHQTGRDPGAPTVVGHVVVRGEPVSDDQRFDFTSVSLPPLPDYLLPVTDDELAVTEAEAAALGVQAGQYRTRSVKYAGWGHASMPRVDLPAELVPPSPNLHKLAYYDPRGDNLAGLSAVDVSDSGAVSFTDVTGIERYGGGELPIQALPPNTRTMSIDGHKFEPTSDATPVMWKDSTEEWAVYNESIECYGIALPDQVTEEFATVNADEQVWYTTDQNSTPQVWGPQTGHPIWPDEIGAENDERSPRAPLAGPPTVKAADHPFHIHQNPFWLIRLEVPNSAGELVNILDTPRWADVSFLPRNGGRAVFRSRFPDFTGEYVNHCHILLHEDNGMMQRIRVLPGPGDPEFDPDGQPANFVAQGAVAQPGAGPDLVTAASAVHPVPTLEEMWVDCASFIDASPTGQVFPLEGWTPVAPPSARPG